MQVCINMLTFLMLLSRREVVRYWKYGEVHTSGRPFSAPFLGVCLNEVEKKVLPLVMFG